MVHHTYNPISIIAALLANSCHRLHSVLSHPHIRCNPHQPVPAGVPGWGSRMENSSLHWHSWETENSDFGKSEPLGKPPQLKTPLYHLCFLRAQGRDRCSMFFSSYSLLLPHSFLSALDAVTAAKLSICTITKMLNVEGVMSSIEAAFETARVTEKAKSLLTLCWWLKDRQKTCVSTVREQLDKLKNSFAESNCKLP